MVYPINKMIFFLVLPSEVAELTKVCPRDDELVKRASGLVVNSGTVNDADLGPVISRQACFVLPHNLCYLYYATRGYTVLITL